ncbi:hypothetical protein [Paraflavitalea speifideaquila]|uniref:hypothetical protein n=1 Tax=Paraflavitalea speifideaquila TaxID=3076558 RepID=UPI0028EDE639|nr:hypothetical protein [Paraflavitalea speifideiaquila]
MYAGQVFEMFRRLHVSSAFEGTGIGLALCKRSLKSTTVLSPPTARPMKAPPLWLPYPFTNP